MAAEPSIHDPEFVRRLFDEMAATYGITNLISSFGFSRRWRKQCVAARPPHSGAHVVDLMTGMGELCPDLARRVGSAGRITAVDLSPVMCSKARRHAGGALPCGVEVLEADALECPLANESADFVYSSFGLKTFDAAQLARIAAQVARILRPGGCFSFVEISVPAHAALRWPYMFYIKRVIPVVGRLFLGNPENYRLLGRYTESFGDCTAARAVFEAAGLSTRYERWFFGCATGFSGRKEGGSANGGDSASTMQ